MPDSKIAASERIRFGIPSLDDLFGDNPLYPNVVGISLPRDAGGQTATKAPRRTSITSLCIMGPDGTGKSVLGCTLRHVTWRTVTQRSRGRNLKSRRPVGLFTSPLTLRMPKLRRFGKTSASCSPTCAKFLSAFPGRGKRVRCT
jgi:hypothetical protein